MSSENLGYDSARQLPLFCPVPACDPELRVVPPGRVNLHRNQEPRRGWISILETPRGATWSSPNGGCPQILFPSPLLGHPLLGAHFLPHCPLAGDSEVRPGQLTGRGTAERVPRARWGSERRSPRVPGAPPALSLAQPPPVPRPWGITADTIPSALTLLLTQPLCKSQRTVN
ncbi:unnamed protein product [Rangifer tarandus platyrhynchus]|uniref:Uncharacterized protein n=1 Tax=Rangifer tarandus platyrhynchus TaxID=3082113 RepID=A0ABN8YY70_RANTA|nr:unnamed protein product [Rangifer tarandus platyrhynchus]